MPADCLTSLIGLSKGSACFPPPADPTAAAMVTTSATGLYVDSAEGLRLQPAAGIAAATDLYERLGKARALAVLQVRAAIGAARANSYGVPLYQQRGTLGGLGNGQLAPAGTRALLRFYTNARREGAWRIPSLKVLTNADLVDTPLLVDGQQVALLSTLKQVASGLPAGGIVLPLDGNEHTLEVVLPEGVRLYQNKVYCFGCNANSPWALAVKNNITGWDSNTLGNGLSFLAVEECTAEPDFLCFTVGSDGDDAQGTPILRYPELARYLGIALMYKAAELFTSDLLSARDTSRYTMLEPKALAAQLANYEAKAAEYLAWLNSPEGLGQVQHPCYFNPPARGMGSQWTG